MIKAGVRLLGILPQTVVAMQVVSEICFDFEYDFVVTSVADGKHKKSSSHYTGRAFDFRVRHMVPEDAKAIASLAKESLGDDFDVILEHLGEPNQHIHVEWDPKVSISS